MSIETANKTKAIARDMESLFVRLPRDWIEAERGSLSREQLRRELTSQPESHPFEVSAKGILGGELLLPRTADALSQVQLLQDPNDVPAYIYLIPLHSQPCRTRVGMMIAVPVLAPSA